ncbi:Uma2 family endonuclease [Jannaschia formosa]|uniref:Uma2 family endonuclease n=1 Tax=Jannaschia formosa TaxID=2259592 RepID=UPI000E1C2487|nr:Uma2 family endonuclease [Jannaschia formosa]TFL16505.1 Uma2 family endonuclease [Jannaschia formosa]
MTRLDQIAKSPATYDDVLAAPHNKVAELIHGALILHPRPASRHALAAASLASKVGGKFHYDAEPGGWWILPEPELHLDADILVPDLAGWRRDRMPEYPEAPFFETPPDWVCEILSPSTRNHDLIDKRALYFDAGVAFLWLVDPDSLILEAFRHTEAGWTLVGAVENDDEVALEPFAAAPFPLAALWPPAPKTG